MGRFYLAATLWLGGCFTPAEPGKIVPDSGTANDGGATQANADLCDEYCTLVGDHCTDELQQYPGSLECKAVCAAMPVGTPDDELGNTANCRRYHGTNAAEDPGHHCIHAGPSGGDVCGGMCESFCSLAMTLCTGDLAQWDEVEACLTDCRAFPTDVTYFSGVRSGDSYACRLYHLTVASLNPETHCPHIRLDSAVCFDAAADSASGG